MQTCDHKNFQILKSCPLLFSGHRFDKITGEKQSIGQKNKNTKTSNHLKLNPLGMTFLKNSFPVSILTAKVRAYFCFECKNYSYKMGVYFLLQGR